MTPRIIFTIILKIFGLWLIIGILEIIPQTLATIPMMIGAEAISIIPIILVLVLIVLFYYFILRLLLFRTDYIIDKLSLDKHFDQQTVDLNVQQTTIIQIAIIILGGLIFIEALPQLVGQIISYLQEKRLQGSLFENPSFKYIIIQGCKLTLGYLLMNNSRRLTDWIEHNRHK